VALGVQGHEHLVSAHKLILAISLLLFMAALTTHAELLILPPGASNALTWDALEKTVSPPAMTNTVSLTFWVTNATPEDITILSTETSCDCTVAEPVKELPWKIPPAESGPMNVRINTRGQHGMVQRQVAVHTSLGIQLLTINLNIPLSPAPFNVSARQQDVMAAKADRQSVFQGHCAACHTWPTTGQTGQALYQSACAICHVSEHRADFVPDLLAFKHPNEPEYWRGVITHGKPGTLMPAFANGERGILDTNQIESLVEYLTQNFISKDSPPPQPSDYLLQH
jgi:mono/diheme cytochrome c family protein